MLRMIERWDIILSTSDNCFYFAITIYIHIEAKDFFFGFANYNITQPLLSVMTS